MSDQFWLTKAQLKRIEAFFPWTCGIPRVDDRRDRPSFWTTARHGLARRRRSEQSSDLEAVWTAEACTGIPAECGREVTVIALRNVAQRCGCRIERRVDEADRRAFRGVYAGD